MSFSTRGARPAGVLDADGVRASFRLYADEPHRRRTKIAIVDAYLAEQTGIDRDGRCSIRCCPTDIGSLRAAPYPTDRRVGFELAGHG